MRFRASLCFIARGAARSFRSFRSGNFQTDPLPPEATVSSCSCRRRNEHAQPMAIWVGRDEGGTEIHLHRLLENVQPALLPVGEGSLDGGGVFGRERDFASACLRIGGGLHG